MLLPSRGGLGLRDVCLPPTGACGEGGRKWRERGGAAADGDDGEALILPGSRRHRW